MAINVRKFLKAIGLLGNSSQQISSAGELEYRSDLGKFSGHDGTSADSLVQETKSAVLQNKSIDADSNTITNIDNNDIKAGAGIVDTKLATISTAGKVSNSATTATDANTASAIVARDASGNFSAGTITAALSGNATTATTATSFSGSLAGDVSGTQGATSVDLVGGKTDTEVAQSVTDTQAATSSNTVSTIVKRDASGNFSAGTITAALSGNATTATTATNVSGTVAIANGGTGQTSQTAAFDALAPTTTAGDLIVNNGTNNVRFAIGSDGQVPVVDTSLTNKLKWATLPTGNKNYITYGTFENNATTGWNKLTVGAVDSTTKAVSGSVTTSAAGITTFAATSTNPLSGTYSLSFGNASSALTVTQGIISDPYTIDREDRAKVLSFKFYYEVTTGASNGNFSGTSSNTLAIWIYDTVNSAWIQPSGSFGMTQSSGVGICQGTFQTPSNMTSFRLALVCINAPSGALVLSIDDVTVGPQQAVVSPTGPVGEIIATGSTTPPTGFLYADGSAVSRTQYSDLFAVIGTTYGAGDGSTTFNLPNLKGVFARGAGSQTIGGISYSATLGTSQGDQMQGHKHNASDGPNWVGSAFNGSTVSGYSASVSTPTDKQMRTSSPIDDGSNGTPRTGSETRPANVAVAYHIRYLSNLVYSSDTDTRVVEAILNSTATSISDGGTSTLSFSSAESDTHGGWNSGTTYTIPVSGYYEFLGFGALSVGTNTAAYFVLEVFKNGSTTNIQGRYDGNTSSNSTVLGATLAGKIKCNAGDTITLKGTQVSGASRTPVVLRFQISRDCGPSQIAASETVAARYKTSSSQSLSSSAYTVLNFDTKDYDTHGSVTTGSGWKFTAPISGLYRVTSFVEGTGTMSGGNVVQLSLGVNTQSAETVMLDTTRVISSGYTVEPNGSTTYRLNAGDYVSALVWHNCTSLTLAGSAARAYINIERVGN